MPELTPRQIALYGLALLTLVVLAAWYAGRGDGTGGVPAAAAAPAIEVDDKDRGGMLVVHVAGAVHRPGVYRMRQGARVDDAVTRAGGPRRRADLGAVNLAAELEDGRQILVPLRAPAAPAGSPTTASSSSGAPAPGVPLNLNTATLEQLDALQGIGPATAQQILDYREEHGGFGSVEELDQVPGIGETRLAALRDKVRV
jgi:competence protein ComEA